MTRPTDKELADLLRRASRLIGDVVVNVSATHAIAMDRAATPVQADLRTAADALSQTAEPTPREVDMMRAAYAQGWIDRRETGGENPRTFDVMRDARYPVAP